MGSVTKMCLKHSLALRLIDELVVGQTHHIIHFLASQISESTCYFLFFSPTKELVSNKHTKTCISVQKCSGKQILTFHDMEVCLSWLK